MDSSFITLGLIGLVAGFIFSMPVAGPISFLITSYAIKGNKKYAYSIALGGTISDFFYCFISVFGSAKLLVAFGKFIPYLLILGAMFIIGIGIKVLQIKHVSLTPETDDNKVNEIIEHAHLQKKEKSGFRDGFLINLLNPTLLITWLIASLIIFSAASSLGLNTGEFNFLLTQNSSIIEKLDSSKGHTLSHKIQMPADSIKITANTQSSSFWRPFWASVVYSVMLSIGTYLWLVLYAGLIIKYRSYIKEAILLRILQLLGVLLVGFGGYLIYKSITLIQA